MRYTQNVAEFVRFNHEEINHLVGKICSDLGVPSQTNDVVQSLYLKFLTKNILSRFNPNHPYFPKISTYLYRIVVNMVKALITDKEHLIEQNRYKFQYFDQEKLQYQNNYGDIEMAINTNGIDTDYVGNLYSNYVTQTPDDIEFDLNMFEKYLKKTNRWFTLERRRYKKIDTTSLSLLHVFLLMRKGYSNKYIAYKYGVSSTFITTLKTEIKLLMIKFGFVWGEIPDFDN